MIFIACMSNVLCSCLQLPVGEEEGDIDEEEELEVGSTASSQKASTSEGQGTSRAFKRAKGTSTSSKMEQQDVSMVAPTSVAFFFPAPPAAAGAKQRLQPLDHLLLPRPAAAAVEGAAVVFLASLPSSKCQAFPHNSLQM